MSNYECITDVLYKGARLPKGSVIQLSDADAKIMMSLRAVKPAEGELAVEPVKTETVGRVNLNTASKAELTAVTYIGDATAQKIIDGRPYATVEAAHEPSGIDKSKWDEIAGELTV